jgi:zinc/manganese transport system substrate-binding protein
LRPLLSVGLLFLVVAPVQAGATFPVVASFSILGDLVQAVGGERVEVHTLVGPGGDAHVYEPTPADARSLSRAGLFVVNGLNFEGWMDRLLQAAGYQGPVVVATSGVEPRRRPLPPDAHGEDFDPHAWQDPANAKVYVRNLLQGLSAADPAGRGLYRKNAERYLAQLEELVREMRETLDAIPPQRRKVVTSHDAFGYFGAAFGIEFLAPVGMNTEAEASAAEVAALIRQIRAERIPAVFVENITDPRLLHQIRRETDARPGGTLYSDALSAPAEPASTYLDMMRYNARTLASALAKAPP